MTTFVTTTPRPRGVSRTPAPRPHHPLLAARIERAGGIAVVDIEGEIDLATCATLRTTVDQELDAAPSGLVLKLSAVTFCGWAGLAVLVDTAQRAQHAGVPLRLVSTRREVLRPLCRTGLADQFQLRPTLERVLEDLPAGG